MKITLSCGRKFHSDHLGSALLAKNALEHIITGNPRFAYKRYDFPEGKVKHTAPFYVPGLLAGRFKLSRAITARLDWWASRQFDTSAAKLLGEPDALVTWAWSARKTLEVAKERGIITYLEECGSANAHQEAILTHEHDLLELSPRHAASKEVIENEQQECELADRILCPSQYVADSFSTYGIPAERCLVIPYATNPKFLADKPKSPGKKQNILYVGSVGPRKGIIYLLRALKQLDPDTFTCTVIGRIEPGFDKVFEPFRELVNHIPSVPHHEIAEYFNNASVFVLPSLDEGMAYVIKEALASATPVITTPNSGAKEAIEEANSGFIVPIRDSDAIATALLKLQSDDTLFQQLSQAALASASSWSWDDYADQLMSETAILQQS